MARPAGNRGMWLLKITSKHHSPERLAWALALGVMLGLVPKLNLLAPCLYVLVFCLPVHTLLAFATGVLVMFVSQHLDPLTGRIGEILLTQPMLGWLWNSLDQAPIVPWLALNNTVVLGSFVVGLMAIAPAYMISLRVFEFLEYDWGRVAGEHNYSSVPTEQSPLVAPPSVDQPSRRQQDRVKVDNQPARPAQPQRERRTDRLPLPAGSHQLAPHEPPVQPVVIPPPKLIQTAGGRVTGAQPVPVSPDEPIDFEPIDEVKSIINSWHMKRGPQQAVAVDALVTNELPTRAVAKVSKAHENTAGRPNSEAAEQLGHFSSSTQPPLTSSAASSPNEEAIIDKLQHSVMEFGLMRDLYPESTWRGDVMTTLEVVQNASQTLAWVDELLDECLADHGITVVAPDLGSDWDQATEISMGDERVAESASRLKTDEVEASSARWLMETTIEIVRWAEDDASAINGPAPNDRDGQMQNSGGKESSETMQPSMKREATSANGSAEMNILPISGGSKRSLASGSQSGFQHLVMASSSKSSAAEACAPIEPVKGECLGYLLGHLKQAREGKSS